SSQRQMHLLLWRLRDLKDPLSMCLRWSLVLVNKLLRVNVSLMAFKIDLCLTLRRNVKFLV
ncbi:MAG TPA: hypothetical protein VKH37_02865, partial [Ferruginibacter sp.]|nr:hypothetical protein [Ferruginibacter sp.]